ncbi:O-antigen ligase [Phenylobacterium sp.]|uniref:O-antigen ligase family protein n=1 Tax=Phenylobacterium sp. TaxID=1871053 RepID=UPI0025F4BE9D|nr:O-antigen ligase family protein [Phenylobacterium sp.]MBX3483740.1 O-antigen ligase family protein [Phenylobacterium sp.]MCW5758158.1 O-antigen ligase family protein [Phenylobacterium sp.]
MLRRLTSPFLRAFEALTPGRRPEEQPLLPGYRRAPSQLLVFGLLSVLLLICAVQGFLFATMAPARVMPFTAPLAILGMLVIWALPQGDYAPTPLLEPLFIGFFAALIVWPNYLAIALPSLPWVTMLRFFGFPLVAVLLICVSTSKRVRAEIGEVLSIDRRIMQFLLGVIVLWTITLPMSREIGVSLNRWIVAQVNWTGMFFVACWVFRREGLITTWSKMFLTLTAVIGAMGIWESRIQQLPWVGFIPPYLRNDDPVVARILAPHARHATPELYRILSVQTTPLGLAELFGLAMPFAVHFALNRYPPWLRVFGALWVPYAIHVILLTQSRLGLVACLSTVAFYVLIWALMRWRRVRASLIGPALVLAYPALFLMLVGATFTIGKLRAKVIGDGSQTASDTGRKEQWLLGFQRLEHNPFGHGMSQASDALGWRTVGGNTSIDSYYLSVLLDIGILGFIFYFGLMIRAAYLGGRTLIANPNLEREHMLLFPLTVSLINFIIVKAVLSQDANHSVVFIMLGAIMALIYRVRKSQGATSGAS